MQYSSVTTLAASILAAALLMPLTGVSAEAADLDRQDRAASLKDSRRGDHRSYDRRRSSGKEAERVWIGYGGPNLWHEFGMKPGDPRRPDNRHYYPHRWGGYAFSAPYFVKHSEYQRPQRRKVPYGLKQKRHFLYEFCNCDQQEEGRW